MTPLRIRSSIAWSYSLLIALALTAAAGCSHGATAGTTVAAPPRVERAVPALAAGVEGVAVGIHGAVSSAESNASAAGLNVLRRGGNAVDAAIAVAFALAVTHPTAGNLGGGGFMLIRMANGQTSALDFRETAPLRATADMYLDKKGDVTRDSVLGARAAGIPGTVAGLALAHRRFGTRAFEELIGPAIALARDGHVLDVEHAADMNRTAQTMREAGFEDSARIYLGRDGTPLKPGERWVQPELAETLQAIAKDGPAEFYQGVLAQRLVGGVQRLGGIWVKDDLVRYRAIERTPLVFPYLGHTIISMPPPSSGGIVLREILGASELLKMRDKPWRSAEAAHLYVEAAKRAYADRNQLLGDPDFVGVPTEQLISAAYVRKRMADIDLKHVTSADAIAAGEFPAKSHQTTHFSVVDQHGNAVAATITLNTDFGAKVVIPGTGVLLNNEMDDFAAKPGSPNVYGLVQSARNAIAPGKRMLSSMTPTIVLDDDGELRAVLGSPGGPTITNTVAQIVRALLDYDRPLDEAVRAPRLHHQWKPDTVELEASFEQDIEQELVRLGHQTHRRTTMGHANCIEVDPRTKGFRAVADVTRKTGSALAY